ncbi:LacI family DNA-binding transcriptional regulator [Celeribacter baekdonensis]|uniref:LacI family transcriptional regulator n=1 Tax=Celeribacter baekdonensis B30 TaxID=1208323 RepID=K2J3K4_9RHOB|nr:LacI family DNA-binding transcriptional regulator [Celeribacter baekdonensis]EKE69628.1 LacI family transcriptional regulator [Celeribacter baekdonensis B30]
MTDPTNPPKIRDVARLAGVSVATVSRALSNPAIVSEQARIAVEKAVAETGYTVNLMARNLRQQQVGAVLALVPNLANPFFSEILAGISDTLRAEGLSLLVLDTLRTDPDTPNGGIRSYLSRSRADGVIVLDGTLDPALFAHGSCPPLVQACEWIEGLAGPRVLADNETGARLAIEHLLGLGHRDIVHLTGPAKNTLSISRAAGVDAALATAGLPPAHRLEGAFTLSSGRAAAEALLARTPRPTAVFCDNDEMAIGLMAGLRAEGLDVPRDFSIVGFDNIEMSAYASVPLTTIRQKRAHLGRCAAERLLAQRTAPTPDETLILPVELVIRDSTAKRV